MLMTSALPSDVASLPGVKQLKHIVVLMMENRSFDHMLGWLDKPGMIGLKGSESNPDHNNVEQPVTRNAVNQGELWPDPSHEWRDTNQQIFGNEQGDPSGKTMKGFIQNYFEQVQDPVRCRNVMNCFTPATLPILSGLAGGFGLCDQWFSSVPGPTLPNRAFVHFGTSFGDLQMSSALGIGEQKQSIYQRLADAGVKSQLYYSSLSSSFAAILLDQRKFFATVDNFFEAIKHGDSLPSYSFLEPSYSVPDDSDEQPNDQHPDHSVLAGEHLILSVYRAIWDNDYLRNSTLLVVTYDEHGGLYDHVTPPTVLPESPPSPEGFTFNRLGVRVPAILISPWIDSNRIDHTAYDHASVPSTLTRLWIGDPLEKSPGIREKHAACFLGNLSRSSAREKSDDPLLAYPSAEDFRLRISHEIAQSARLIKKRKMSLLVEKQVKQAEELNKKLPEDLQSNIEISTLHTAGEAGSFIRNVMQAAHQHIASLESKESATKGKS